MIKYASDYLKLFGFNDEVPAEGETFLDKEVERLKEKYATRNVAQALSEAINKLEEKCCPMDNYVALLSTDAYRYLQMEPRFLARRDPSPDTEKLARYDGIPIWPSCTIDKEMIDFILMPKQTANKIIAMDLGFL